MSEEVDCNPSEIEAPTELTDERLKLQIERLRSLRSAWSALAPSCLIEQADEVALKGRAVTDALVSLSGREGALNEPELSAANAELRDFESVLHDLVSQVPVSQFRSTLPSRLQSDRQSLLDLLDLMLVDPQAATASGSLLIAPIDYLVTLLCTNSGSSGGQVLYDPVTLTSRIADLCSHVQSNDDLHLEAIEAEFFAAATMDREDLRQEMQQRTFRNRKAELGMEFFAPRILRAVVTYNASLYHLIADEMIDSEDWGVLSEAPVGNPSRSEPAQSVFESERLRTIANAARRRARGEDAQPCDEDRIAWALDFEYLAPSEKKALTQTSVGTQEDPLGTAILVGLLCRSLAVLSIELQNLDISPDLVSDTWVGELEAVFQQSINEKITGDAYKAACALSELKNKFLLAPLSDQYRSAKFETTPTAAPTEQGLIAETEETEETEEASRAKPDLAPEGATTQTHLNSPRLERPIPRAPKPKPAPKRESALDLVRSALDEDAEPKKQERAQLSLADMARLKILGLAGLVLSVGFSLVMMNHNPDLKRWSTDQLESVSPYLDQGQRNGDGQGSAFVGEITPKWAALPQHVREASGEDLVRRLREQGVQQIMIYDQDRRVRIQAVGSQPIQIK